MNENRCSWCGTDPLYMAYHDMEWGVPVYDDQKLFEFLILENFQAGLSWITVLRKRENFRRAFDEFDYKKVGQYGDKKYNELINNAGIIRNKLKIKAAISNANAFMNVQKEFGSFANYIWGFVYGVPVQNAWKSDDEIPATTPVSDAISK